MVNGSSIFISHIRSAAPWALRHLLFSLLIFGVLAAVVFCIWFPGPFIKISGGWSLLLLIFAVDVVCGPLLTLLLLYPGKSPQAMRIDIVLIFFIQASALIYGIHSLSQARPIALVFEVDRFRVVSYSEIDTSHPEAIPAWVSNWSLVQPRILGTRGAKDPKERLESLDASLQGLEPGARPHWWQKYELSVPLVKMRFKPIEELINLNPNVSEEIQNQAERAVEQSLENEARTASEMMWLPIVGRQSSDWVALVDPNSARVRGYVHADGFGK